MRILLVEDDEALASAVCEQIAADGHAVDCARRLDDANDDLITNNSQPALATDMALAGF